LNLFPVDFAEETKNMKNYKKYKLIKGLSALFFIVSILDIIGVALNISLLQVIFKPMIILSLIVLYYFSAKKKNSWYLIALVFSFMGDVLLMDKNNLFLYGIASFLITQLLFVYIIVKQIEQSSTKDKLFATIPFLIYFLILISTLKTSLGEFLIPVIVYGIAISIFGSISLLNYLVNKTKNSQILVYGAVLFIASDSMIALHKFHEPRKYYPVIIMVTYVLAQYLIYKFIIGKPISNNTGRD
jgi:uncharacterized membrane protein YhhN